MSVVVSFSPSRPRGPFDPRWSGAQAREASSRELAVLAFDHFHAMVYSTSRRISGSPHDAHDVMQDVFVELLEHAQRLRDPAAVPGFLKTLAVRLTLRQTRRLNVFRRIAAAWQAVDVGAPMQGLALEVEQVLSRLSTLERAAVVLRFVEEQTVDEVASLLNVSVSTVQRTLRTAKHKVSEEIAAGRELLEHWSDS